MNQLRWADRVQITLPNNEITLRGIKTQVSGAEFKINYQNLDGIAKEKIGTLIFRSTSVMELLKRRSFI